MNVELLGPIVLEGMKVWREERRLAFQKKYEKILRHLSEASSEHHPSYNDARKALAKRDLKIFLLAYNQEQVIYRTELESKK